MIPASSFLAAIQTCRACAWRAMLVKPSLMMREICSWSSAGQSARQASSVRQGMPVVVVKRSMMCSIVLQEIGARTSFGPQIVDGAPCFAKHLTGIDQCFLHERLCLRVASLRKT